MPGEGYTVGSTRENIDEATTVEADEIDRAYPAIIERISPEGHEQAIQTITWAWKAERQHRDLILRIQSAARKWFGILVSRIEGEPNRYYVCGICGSTLTEHPEHQCPICGRPADHYVEVPGFPGDAPKDPFDFGW
jgi:rubrerythrin